MSELRRVTFDLARLPTCHACGVPAVIERDGRGIYHATFMHEPDCRVPRSPADRLRLDAALADATARELDAGGPHA